MIRSLAHIVGGRSRRALLPLLVAALSCGGSPEPAPPPAPRPAPAEPAQSATPPETVRTDESPGGVVEAPMQLYGVDLDTVHAGRFDQGKMWTFEYPPTQYFADTYGFEPDSAWFAHARLGALRIEGCSASFVSPHGLLLTNHHCAREFATASAEEGEDVLDNGFYAHSLDEERPVEDFHADQLIAIVDVTAEVESKVGDKTGQDRAQALQSATDDIQNRLAEARGGEDAGIQVEVISLYNGGLYSAYVFKRYTNAKLVMVPELQIGFYGGDPDNFTYPRYNLDFSFFRIYGDDGQPLDTPNYFPFDPDGVSQGEPIFIVGNPGSTSRLQTVAELEFRRDVGDKGVLEFLKSRAEVFQEFIDAFPDEAERYDLRNTLFGLRNSEKAYQGQLEGLRDPVILARRRDTDEQFREAIQADPALAQQYGGLMDEMAQIQQQKRALGPGFDAFLALTSGDYASATLYRALLAFQIVNARQNGAPESATAGLMDQLEAVKNQPDVLDQLLIEARIQDFIDAYGEDANWVRNILRGRTPEGAAAAIHDQSVLSDSASAVEAVRRGTLDVNDAAIRLVGFYVPTFARFQQGISGLTQRETEVAAKLGRARFEVYGTDLPPDATFSLRIADGVVKGYPYNGTEAPIVTTFYGMYDRHFSFQHMYGDDEDSPWALPPRWATPPEGLDLSTPLDFVSTADIIGGNSGSPVLSKDLKLVGLVFDGNIESLPGDYIYLPELNRSVAVDSRGILAALDTAYDMDRLVAEVVDGTLYSTEAEADRARR